MENEIKANEFVRYKDGDIIQIFQKIDREYIIKDNKDRIYTLPEKAVYKDIVKHSPNLKDLIQKDDFVNKCRVYEVEEKGIIVYQTVEHSTTNYNWISFDEIEEVVTKEMMETISYKVK